MKISKRLEAVANLVSPNRIIVDIGTDHGYVPIYLISHNIINKAVAADVGEGPLSRAVNNIKAYGLEGKIKTILSDGFKNVPKDDIDTAVIAGMGGDLIVNILSVCDYVKDLDELVLSPHKHADLVRLKLKELKFEIVEEKMIKDEGKFYPIIKAINSKNNPDGVYCADEVEVNFGPVLLKQKDEVLKEFLETEYNKFINFKKKTKNDEPVLDAKIALLKQGLDRVL